MADERPRDERGQYLGTLNEEQVVEAVCEAGHVATTAEVSDALDTSQDTARRWLTELHAEGTVARKKVGARGVVWWLTDPPPDVNAGGAFVIECNKCGREESYPRTVCRSCESETTVIDDDWRNLGWHQNPNLDGPEDRRPGSGLCWVCVTDMLDEAEPLAREKGRVPCRTYGHSTHELHSNPLTECRQAGSVPFSDEEMDRLRAAYREVRAHECPDCGAHRENFSTATAPGPNFKRVTVEREKPLKRGTEEIECLECRTCGWQGHETEMAFRKQD